MAGVAAGAEDESPRARIATRTCEGRPLGAAGVNLKSPIDVPRLANAAASFGSAVAGVKLLIGSKVSETAGGRRSLPGLPEATAGSSTSTAAAAAPAQIAALFPLTDTGNDSLLQEYSGEDAKVPRGAVNSVAACGPKGTTLSRG